VEGLFPGFSLGRLRLANEVDEQFAKEHPKSISGDAVQVGYPAIVVLDSDRVLANCLLEVVVNFDHVLDFNHF